MFKSTLRKLVRLFKCQEGRRKIKEERGKEIIERIIKEKTRENRRGAEHTRITQLRRGHLST